MPLRWRGAAPTLGGLLVVITRDLSGLTARRYDLVVVGGGIHGRFAAYDAASRGLAVALVEQADFGSGLSFNHQRTIHGGLRALEHGRLGTVYTQMRERRTWARIAPHLLRPLPFLVGTYRFTKRSRLVLGAGLAAYDLIGRARNADVTTELHLPKSRLESAATTRRLFPGIATDNLTGGAVWYDYQMVHPDRLVWTVALAARLAGAMLTNYTAAIAPLRDQGRIVGVRVKDVFTAREHDVEAAVTLLAAGAGLPALAGPFDLGQPPPLVRATNLLLDRPGRDIALAARGPDGRMLTAVPWRGYALVGTMQGSTVANPDEAHLDRSTVDAALAAAQRTFPALEIDRAAIRLVHSGLTPALVRKGRVDLQPETGILRPGQGAPAGVFALVGVKFTAAREAAETAVDNVFAVLGRKAHGTTATTPLPHAGIADVEGLLSETLRSLDAPLAPDEFRHLTAWYGTEAPSVASFGAARGLLTRLGAETPVLAAEIAYAVEHAFACKLSDVVLRRTMLGSAGRPSDAVLASAADTMAAAAHWTPTHRATELRDLLAVYAAP
jgi:glycerol-3-phosphate dehydrogenase